MEQNPRLGLLFFHPDSPLRSRGLGTATGPSRSRLGIVAALESLLTLLSWLLARFPHAHYRSQIAYTLPFHSTYLASVPLSCLRLPCG